jgi:hypothetical protein
LQYIQTPALYFEGHSTVWRIVKYLSVALAGLIAVRVQSPGVLIVLAIAFTMGLALAERVRKLQAVSSVNPQARVPRLSGDGGSFPGAEPENEHQESGAPRVLDGGSF